MELDKIKQNKVYEMAGTLFALRLQLALFPLSLPNPQNNLIKPSAPSHTLS